MRCTCWALLMLLLSACPTADDDDSADDDDASGVDDDDAADDDDSADDDDAADDDDSADDDDATPVDPPLIWPTFSHLDQVVDLARGTTPAWASLVYVQEGSDGPEFQTHAYADTADRTDFWVASTIKIYTATAALMLLDEHGLSLDTDATFYRRADPADAWTEDTTVSVRQMIFDVFDHSSNSDYTLLLRLAGIDWLSTELFTPENGLEGTALLVGYVSDRPYRYDRDEEQRIVLSDGGDPIERIHLWSGTEYDDLVGCEFQYGPRANCSPPAEMAEHMRRLMFHEWLPPDEQFAVDPAHLDWMRYGDADGPVMNQADSPWADGIRNVFPDAEYQHKAGRVSDYALDLHHVDDVASDTRFTAAVVTESSSTAAYDAISEELTRMLRTPQTYVHLDWLTDYVNPVVASLWVHTDVPGTLSLISKPYDEDGHDEAGWTAVPGTDVALDAGESWQTLTSDCVEASLDGQQHVRGRFTPDDGAAVATSDLHFVIVDADIPCP
jgi:hypothetical protein